MYGGAARALQRGGGGGGIVKIFHWEGEPQRELDTATTTTTTTTTTSLRILQLIIRTTASTSVAPPSSRTADNTALRIVLYSTLRTATERTAYAPGDL